MDEFDPFSPSSHRSQPRSDSSMLNKNLEHVSEAGARYRRLDDQFNTYCVAVESAIMVVEDNDRRGSPSFTIEARGNLVAAAHAVKVSLRQYRTFLNSLHLRRPEVCKHVKLEQYDAKNTYQTRFCISVH